METKEQLRKKEFELEMKAMEINAQIKKLNPTATDTSGLRKPDRRILNPETLKEIKNSNRIVGNSEIKERPLIEAISRKFKAICSGFHFFSFKIGGKRKDTG